MLRLVNTMDSFKGRGWKATAPNGTSNGTSNGTLNGTSNGHYSGQNGAVNGHSRVAAKPSGEQD